METNETIETAVAVFRRLESADELLRYLRLRAEVYLSSRLKVFCKDDDTCIDVDSFDGCSSHFGLFLQNHGCETMIGGIRVFEGQVTRAQRQLVELSCDYPSIAAAIESAPQVPFPCLQYWPQRQLVSEFLKQRRVEGEVIVEPSRLVLAPLFRSLRLAAAIVEAAIARYFLSVHAVDRAILSFAASQEPFYRRYGFDRVPGTEICIPRVGLPPTVILTGTPGAIPPLHAFRIRKMAEELDATGAIRFAVPPSLVARQQILTDTTEVAA